jgi:metal-responsive CopG/Arc/MetJ family transcriptional regulator
MKTSVSIPDEIFEGVERLARRMKKSRSRLFNDAVREYLARHAPEEVRASMDRVCAVSGSPATDEFVATAAWRTLKQSAW